LGTMKEEIDEFVQRVQQAAGENLESIVLYGSAARDDFSEHYSDLNLLCVVRDAGAEALYRLAAVVEWWSKAGGHRSPLFLTADELRDSADVFAIETLDIKTDHRILVGTDVLAGIEVPMNLHRVQLEHELRTMLFRLRQHFLLFADNEHELQEVLAKSVSSLVVLLRHAIIALGHEPSKGTKRQWSAQAGQLLRLDVAAVDAALDLREGRRIECGARELYDRVMKVIAGTVQQVEKAVPKREWQRTTRNG
jgi:predicted nucleotidyltransferase